MSKKKVKPVIGWTTENALTWPYVYQTKKEAAEWNADDDSKPFKVEIRRLRQAKKGRGK